MPAARGLAVIEILLESERSLTVGQLDAAERLYWQAIEGDPRNSIAVVGLARVALERGDEPTAYQLARKALEIDPENTAAQRLAARMGEVIAYRGDQVPTGPLPELRHAGPTGAAPPARARPSAPAPNPPVDKGAVTAPGSKRRGLFGRILGR